MSTPKRVPMPGGGSLRLTRAGGVSGNANFVCTCGEHIIIYIHKEWPASYAYEWEIGHYNEEIMFEQVELCEEEVFIKLAELLELTNCTVLGVTDGI